MRTLRAKEQEQEQTCWQRGSSLKENEDDVRYNCARCRTLLYTPRKTWAHAMTLLGAAQLSIRGCNGFHDIGSAGESALPFP